MTPVAGSLVSTRSSFCAASGVPSATVTWPAWIERPMPTPPPWWIDTHDAPLATLTIALSSGQALKGDLLLGHPDPARERLVLGEHVEHGLVGGRDVRGVARERRPPERA